VPNRHGSSDSYRYGFNGKENDNEIIGEGNFEDYGMRSYNPRIGRFFSVDPLTHEYPSLTPYQFASNSPIAGIDRDGEEFEPYWATTVPAKIKAYEKDLYKKDPKHAEEIIRQHNIDAFLFVGGALSAGSSVLSTVFMDGTFSYGGYKYAKGSLNNNPEESLQGARIMGGVFLAEAGGILVGKLIGKLSKFSLTKPVGSSNSEGGIIFSLKQEGKIINVGEVNLNNGTLELDLGVPLELQGKGIGKSMFDQSIKFFGSNIKKIQGLWTDGTNLNLYNKLIKSGKSPQEAAFGTVTGKWAKEHGFDKVEIIQDLKMKNGDSGSVKVNFSKTSG
jgi:RHS repeat-associated protein